MRFAFLAALIIASRISAQSPIEPRLARLYFEETKKLSEADAGKLWGRQVSGPMMFVDPASHAIVANEADAQGKLHMVDGLWMGTLPAEMNPANTAFDYAGKRYTMVMWPVSDGRYGRRRLLLHESFHRIQPALGFVAANPQNEHLATAEGRIWTRLEWRALTEALLHTGAARKAALADALTFRARRRTVSPKAAEEENQLEMNEGLAEYTGLVLSGLPRSVLADRAAVALAQNESQESFARSFAYSSGPAYALLLDESGATWRKNLKPDSDLSALAKRLYGIGAIDPRNADGLVARYDGARMVANERKREETRLANEKRLRSLFNDSLVLRLPAADKFDFSFDPNGATPLAGMGTVYSSARITDSWGTLEVDNGDVLMARNENGHITGVVAALPVVTGNVVKGKGWTLTLADGWTTSAAPQSREIQVVKR
jgi:hypothetical protein